MWISVEDRLPEVEKPHGVPACSKDFLLIWPRTTYTQTALYFEDCGFARDGVALTHVTHWQPLPEPPEDGEKFRTVKPAPIESTNFTRAECMAAIAKVDAADEITKRRQAKPDYELDVYIIGVRIGDSGKVQWHIRLDDDVDTLQAADILEKATEVLLTNSEPPESES